MPHSDRFAVLIDRDQKNNPLLKRSNCSSSPGLLVHRLLPSRSLVSTKVLLTSWVSLEKGWQSPHQTSSHSPHKRQPMQPFPFIQTTTGFHFMTFATTLFWERKGNNTGFTYNTGWWSHTRPFALYFPEMQAIPAAHPAPHSSFVPMSSTCRDNFADVGKNPLRTHWRPATQFAEIFVLMFLLS